MRLYGSDNMELCIWTVKEDLYAQTTQEDNCGDVKNQMCIKLTKEQAIKVANYILNQYKSR